MPEQQTPRYRIRAFELHNYFQSYTGNQLYSDRFEGENRFMGSLKFTKQRTMQLAYACIRACYVGQTAFTNNNNNDTRNDRGPTRPAGSSFPTVLTTRFVRLIFAFYGGKKPKKRRARQPGRTNDIVGV